MTYASETAAISRKPCDLVVVTLDACSLVYGIAPCTATAAEKCTNTYYTCRDRANYALTTKDYDFTSFDASIPFAGPRPYIDSISSLPTEIGKEITVVGRLKITMLDELSDDVGIDPYYATRSSIQGEFWKKLVARNPNYQGRPVKHYSGYVGMTRAEFLANQRWKGTIDNITINNGKVTLDCSDTIADLKSVTYPAKIKTGLSTNISDSETAIVLTSLVKEDGNQIDSTGYIQIDDEIIYYTSLTPASVQINVPGGGRGYFGTTAAAHTTGSRVSLVKYFAPANPFTHLKSIWDDAGGDYATEFDTAEWTKWQSWPTTDVNFSTIITDAQQITGADAFWEIANILDLHIWQDESQKITVRRNIGNDPDRTYTDITDTANIISKSGGVDYNSKDRKTRLFHYWNKSVLGEFDKVESFTRTDISRLADEESANGFGDVIEESLFNRWISLRFLSAADAVLYVARISKRRTMHRSFARPLITVSVELKDEGIKTGDVVKLTTDERLDVLGNPISINHLVVKRTKNKNKITLVLKELPKKRLCIIAPAANPATYALSSEAQREYGFIAGGKDDLMPNGDPGYYTW